MRILLLALLFSLFSPIASANELSDMSRQWEVEIFIELNLTYKRNKNWKCDFPIQVKALETGEKYFIAEYWCKENIFRYICHDEASPGTCIIEPRKREPKKKW